MAIASYAYGESSDVAALVSRYRDKSVSAPPDFGAATNPNKGVVENLINQVSAMLNAQLRALGFTTPLTTDEGTEMMVLFVSQEVASIVEGINGSGRFGPSAKNQQARFQLIAQDTKGYLESIAPGLQELGETRARSGLQGIAHQTDETTGEPFDPIFARDQFEFQVNTVSD